MSPHYLVKCQHLKATTEDKTSVTTHFKKLTTGNNVFLVSVIIHSTCNCRILQYVQCVRLAAGQRTPKWVSSQKSSCFQLLLLKHDISQGSVATHLRCGGFFSDGTITDFLLILKVKKFGNCSICDKVIRRPKMCQFFGATLYTHRYNMKTAAINNRVTVYK